MIGCHETCKPDRNYAELPRQCSLSIHPLKVLSPKWTPCMGVDSAQFSRVCKLIAIGQKSRTTPLSPPSKTYLHFICLCRSHPKEESQLGDRWETDMSLFFPPSSLSLSLPNDQAMHLYFHRSLILWFLTVHCCILLVLLMELIVRAWFFFFACELLLMLLWFAQSYTFFSFFFLPCSCYDVVGL